MFGPDRFVARLRASLRGAVEETLAQTPAVALPQRARIDTLAARLDRLGGRADALHDRIQQSLEAAAAVGPITAETTVARAWLRHPGVRAVFASRHLPACDGCTVRHDERLWEVADAYGFDLAAFLADLNAAVGVEPGSGVEGSTR